MELIKTQQLFDVIRLVKPDVLDRTIHAHIRLLNNMQKSGIRIDSQPVLGDILGYIDSIENLNSKCNYYCAVSVLYQGYPASSLNVCLIKICREKISVLKSTIQLQLDEHKKTTVQKKNWVSHKKILTAIKKQGEVAQEIMENGFTGSKSTIKTVQNWIIQCLYMLDPENPPVRCNYVMKVLYGNQRLSAFVKYNAKQNYLIVNKNSMSFVFNKYKTQKHYGRKIQKVGDQLYQVLKLWLTYRENPVDLLINTRNKALSENNLSIYIAEAFSIYNCKLTIDTIRHIFISDNVNLGNSKKYAKLMHHSIDEQRQYWKE